MNQAQMKQRTKDFALRAIKVVRALPRSTEGRVVGTQFLRSATGVGANYRAACRARSRKEFVARLGIVEEEADESCFWMEIIGESGLLPARRLAALLKEGNELVKIVVAASRTARGLRSRARRRG
jgi:four helix bundle protein